MASIALDAHHGICLLLLLALRAHIVPHTIGRQARRDIHRGHDHLLDNRHAKLRRRIAIEERESAVIHEIRQDAVEDAHEDEGQRQQHAEEDPSLAAGDRREGGECQKGENSHQREHD